MSTKTSNAVEHPIGMAGLFLLHVASGDVRLRGIDGDTVRVEDRSGADLADSFDIEAGERSLAIRARENDTLNMGRRRTGSLDLDVRVPRRATIVVEAASADLSGEDLAGELRLHTASGDIDLERVSGTIAVEAVSGDIGLTATGELRLRATTVSGDLAVRAGSLAEVTAITTSGDLTIAGELAPNATHKVETVSGDTLLALVGGARIEVSTVTGDVTADVPHRSERADGRRILVIGDGRATLLARTMSGDVHVAAASSMDVAGGGEPAAGSSSPEPAPAEPRSPSDAAIAAADEEARLGILRTLERGEIDVAEAGRRLEALDSAGIAEAARPEEEPRG